MTERADNVSGFGLDGVCRRLVVIFGLLASAGLTGYALSYLIASPDLGAGEFVPASAAQAGDVPSAFATALAGFAALYAVAFLPVAIVYTVRLYRSSPFALVLAGCFAAASSLIELVNNLPVLALGSYRGGLERVPDAVLLRLVQVDAVCYLALDVAGFTLIYAAFVLYGLTAAGGRRRWPVAVVLASVAVFIASVPCLWIAPAAAAGLLAASVLLLAPIPPLLARLATTAVAGPEPVGVPT